LYPECGESIVSNFPSDPPRQRLTLTHWLILIMAAIGFGFDIYVLLVMQYIGKGALEELLPGVKPGSPEFNHWRGLLFFVPAFVGGLFGLIGGYLTDVLGRRRVLTGSILLYALSAFASAYSTSLTQLLVFRCLTFIGVCVEFVAAVAWLAELFPNHDQRERVLGYTQAFSSFGGLAVATVFHSMPSLIPHLPTLGMPAFLAGWLGVVQNGQAAWRFTLLSGVLPAIPLILIRPFMPESPIWKQKKLAGTLKRPSIRELFDARFRKTTIVTTIMFACSYGAAFGAIQQTQYMVPAMPQYQERTKGLTKPAEKKAVENEMTAGFGQVQEIGGLIGRFLLAALAVYIVSRRGLLRIFQVPGLIIVPLVFAFLVVQNRVLFTVGFASEGPSWLPSWIRGLLSYREVTAFHIGIFLAGLLTVAQFSFWGNYLPTVYPIHLRGTGQSVSANIGGRMIGTSFAFISSELAGLLKFGDAAVNSAYAAAMVGLFVYVVGSVACFFLPEPKPGTMTAD
jgi:MFS family permease